MGKLVQNRNEVVSTGEATVALIKYNKLFDVLWQSLAFQNDEINMFGQIIPSVIWLFWYVFRDLYRVSTVFYVHVLNKVTA